MQLLPQLLAHLQGTKPGTANDGNQLSQVVPRECRCSQGTAGRPLDPRKLIRQCMILHSQVHLPTTKHCPTAAPTPVLVQILDPVQCHRMLQQLQSYANTWGMTMALAQQHSSDTQVQNMPLRWCCCCCCRLVVSQPSAGCIPQCINIIRRKCNGAHEVHSARCEVQRAC